MNKSELIKHLATQTGQTQKSITELFSALDLTLKNNAAVGAETNIGLLTVTTAAKAARMGRNPATGQPQEIPAKNVIKVKVGKALKGCANWVGA